MDGITLNGPQWEQAAIDKLQFIDRYRLYRGDLHMGEHTLRG